MEERCTTTEVNRLQNAELRNNRDHYLPLLAQARTSEAVHHAMGSTKQDFEKLERPPVVINKTDESSRVIYDDEDIIEKKDWLSGNPDKDPASEGWTEEDFVIMRKPT